MASYTVHEPPTVASEDERATRIRLIREGFAWGALLVPVVWFALNRLWLETLALVALTAVFGAIVQQAPATADTIGWLTLGINIILGFEARNIQRAALARRGWRLTGIVTAPTLVEAERRFFAGWQGGTAELAPRRRLRFGWSSARARA